MSASTNGRGALERVLEVRELEQPEELEVLYWLGCAVATDARLQAVARAFVRVLNRAGVRFAVLGPEECCTGDPARRTGNEFHFRMLATANIETLDRYRIRRIVTHCPHCLHTLRNEYPRLGGSYEVMHHTEFVRALIESGRLRLSGSLRERLTYHDPCYLGRYNDIYDAPREVLHRIGAPPTEMKRSRERSFCCGAGGGHVFYEDPGGGRVNLNRAREALATGATTVCTACPFCLSMMEEGIRGADPESDVRVRDLVELVDELLSRADAEAGSPTQVPTAVP